MRFVLILIGMGLLLAVGCGGGTDEGADSTTAVAAATVGATAEPSVVATPTVLVNPTPDSSRVPQPTVVRPTATLAPVVTPAAEAVMTPTPITPTAVVLSPTPTIVVPVTPELVGDIDCGYFESHREAQIFYLEDGGPSNDDYELDTDGDGIAFNFPDDRGYDRIRFALFGAPTATPEATVTATVPRRSCNDFATWQEAYDFFISEGGPRSDPHNMDGDKDGVPCTALKHLEENPPSPTPTFPPAEAAIDVWSSNERAAELNSIDWAAFEGRDYGYGVWQLIPEGETLLAYWKGVDSSSQYGGRIELDCAPRFGNRLDKSNPTYVEGRTVRVWLWIEPTDGNGALCVQVDLYRNWLPSDAPPLPKVRTYSVLPHADRADPIVFTDPVNGPRLHTLPSVDLFSLGITGMGKTFDVIEGDLECIPQNVPVAMWTRDMGFEVLGRDEEELLARDAFPYTRDEERGPDEYWEAYDWEQKESWRNAGWFLAVIGDLYDGNRRGDEPWNNNVRYGSPALASCWFVRNTADLPPPRYCLECERRENMARLAEQTP